MTTAVHRGDLRLIVPPFGRTGEARVGLVLGIHQTLDFTVIALVHPYAELSTSLDGVVPSALAGTAYDVVVQTDLRGAVWTPGQVSRLVGRLSEATLEAISDLVDRGRPESAAGIRIGTPLAGPRDRRWSFKAAEGRALDLLTSDCSGHIITRSAGGRGSFEAATGPAAASAVAARATDPIPPPR